MISHHNILSLNIIIFVIIIIILYDILGEDPLSRAWHPTPFSLGESHG